MLLWIFLLGGATIALVDTRSGAPSLNRPGGSDRILGTSFRSTTITANFGSWMIATDGNGAQWGIYPVVGGWNAISEAYDGTSRFFHRDLGFEEEKKCVLWSKGTPSSCVLYDPAPRTGLAQLIDDYARSHFPHA